MFPSVGETKADGTYKNGTTHYAEFGEGEFVTFPSNLSIKEAQERIWTVFARETKWQQGNLPQQGNESARL